MFSPELSLIQRILAAVVRLGIEKSKMKLELYDRRKEVYENFVRYINAALTDLNPTLQETYDFIQSTQQVPFLFKADIEAYQTEFIRHGMNLRKWHDLYALRQALPPGYNLTMVINGRIEEAQWFSSQHEKILKKFDPYLNVSHF